MAKSDKEAESDKEQGFWDNLKVIPGLERVKKLFKPKTPKDWIDRYLKKEYGDELPSVTDAKAEVLEDLPSDPEEKAYIDILFKHAMHTRPVVRQVVEEEAIQTIAPEPEPSNGLNYFKEQLRLDSYLSNPFTSFKTIFALLYDKYKYPNDSVLERARFDQTNLQELLRAVFSQMRGEVLAPKDIVGLIKHPGQKVQDKLYFHMFGLSETSTEDEVNARIKEFKTKTSRLNQLLSYEHTGNIHDCLAGSYKVDAKGNAARTKTAAEIVEEGSFGNDNTFLFDADAIKQMLTEVEKNQKRAYYTRIYEANQGMPAFEMLRDLQQVFQTVDNARFDTLMAQLNALFPEVPSLCDQLWEAGKDDNSSVILIQKIAEVYGKNDPEFLKRKLAEIHEKISQKFHQLLHKDDIAEHTIDDDDQLTEAVSKPAIDFVKFYKEIMSNSNRIFKQLWNLHFALRRTEVQYNEKNKGVHFEGKDQNTVLNELDKEPRVGEDLRIALQIAAIKSKEPPYQFYGLMQAIATHYNITDPEELKFKLREVSSALDLLYPNLGA